MPEYPESVRVVEVGARDGLQNESSVVPTAVKIEFIERLASAGLPAVEATSFVDPRWVPQLADAHEVLSGVKGIDGVEYPVLVPNQRGLERALDAGARQIAIFVSATETFSKKNLNRSREEVFEVYAPVCAAALDAGCSVRGYISMVVNDPWEGPVAPAEVLDAAKRLLELGCSELSLGDTTGAGTSHDVAHLLEKLLSNALDIKTLAVHFHDTYGQGLANVLTALQMGVTTVDSSAGGLGGCPFARSATGNLATEDLVWMLDGMGIKTGVDVKAVAAASQWLCKTLAITPPGRAARALR